MNNQTDFESILQERLDELKAVPERDPQTAARSRARFLAQAVSASEFQRHKGWKSIFRKEQFAMNVLMSILVFAGLLFGGGVTVNAAQDDLPNEPLYALKTWSEDISLQFQNSPEAKVDQLMELAQTRSQEMAQLIESGQPSSDQARLRLEQHIEQALQICSNMDDAALDQTLLQLRDQLQQQDRDMERLQIHAPQDDQPILERTRTMLQTRLQLIDTGLLDHEMFRNNVRHGFNYGQTQTPPTAAPSAPATPRQEQNGQPTTQPGGQMNGEGAGSNPDPGGPNPKTTPMPNNSGNGPTSGNNSSGNGGSSESGSGNNGGDGSGGNGSGGDGSGSEDSGGNGSGGNDTGGNGPGGNGP